MSDPESRCLGESSHDAGLPGQGAYLDRLMRRASFAALWPLFAKATKPAKELTESFSALEHLRPLIRPNEPLRVLHIGDGAHARTAALFSLKTKAENISVDPLLNEPLVEAWRMEFDVRRFAWRKSAIEDVALELSGLPAMRTLVTFVHAHVNVDRVLALLPWDGAFTLACCLPGIQLSTTHRIHHSGSDENVLSTGRAYQVLLPPCR
ncbi:MAG: hypothetical protein ABUL62_05005 [Myxococcales bacterium]